MNTATWLGRLTTLAVALVIGALSAGGCAEKPDAPGAGGGVRPAVATPTNDPSTNTSFSATGPGWPPTKAQPKLRTLKLYIGSEVVTSELALSQVEVGTGMMFRTSMPEDEGMLFVFANPHRTSFYMKNTTVPLTAAYIDPEGVILELVELNPLVEAPVEAKFDNVQYVLEMNQGWFKRHNLSAGTTIATERGSLPKTFGFAK